MSLRELCRVIRERHNNAASQSLQCVVCDNVMQGADALMIHFKEFHGVTLEHLDNVSDLEGFLNALQGLVRCNGVAAPLVCPISACLRSCSGVEEFVDHLACDGHGLWSRETIPALAPFCMTFEDGGDDDEEVDVLAQDDVDIGAEGDVDDDELEDERVTCLFCDACLVVPDLDVHLDIEHRFQLTSYVASHREVITDEYSLIRMVNYVRECKEDGRCPHGSSCDASSSESLRSTGQWSAHVTEARHFFPLLVPENDKYLIPRIAGDMFISFVMECGEHLFDGDEEEVDYPMVDTVRQHAAKMTA